MMGVRGGWNRLREKGTPMKETPDRAASWHARIAAAFTAQHYGIIAVATLLADKTGHAPGTPSWYDTAVTEARRMEDADFGREYNRRRPTTTQVVALHKVAVTGPEGLAAHSLDTQVRIGLGRAGWITVRDRHGQPVPASTWTGQVRLTVEGAAQLQAGRCRLPTLTDAQAGPLDTIDRAGSGGRQGAWPGSRTSCEVAIVLELARRVQGGFVLTDAGRDAVRRWRDSRATPLVTAEQAALLEELRAGRTLPGEHRPYAPATYQACERNGWIRWGDLDPVRRKRPALLTPQGERALREHSAAPKTAAAPRTVVAENPPMPVGDLGRGMRVRLRHRQGYTTGGEWVVVDHVERVTTRPGGWRVWVAGVADPVPYASGTVFHSRTLFDWSGNVSVSANRG